MTAEQVNEPFTQQVDLDEQLRGLQALSQPGVRFNPVDAARHRDRLVEKAAEIQASIPPDRKTARALAETIDLIEQSIRTA